MVVVVKTIMNICRFPLRAGFALLFALFPLGALQAGDDAAPAHAANPSLSAQMNDYLQGQKIAHSVETTGGDGKGEGAESLTVKIYGVSAEDAAGRHLHGDGRDCQERSFARSHRVVFHGERSGGSTNNDVPSIAVAFRERGRAVSPRCQALGLPFATYREALSVLRQGLRGFSSVSDFVLETPFEETLDRQRDQSQQREQ